MCLPTVAVAAEDLLDEANRQCPVSLADTTVGWVTVHVFVDQNMNNGNAVTTPSLTDNYNIPGFITDMTKDSEANPLTTVGVSFCTCKALAEWDCDAPPTALADSATLLAGQITAPGTATTGAVTSSKFAEYAVVSLALRRIGGNTDAANLVTTGAVTIDSEKEKNEVSALLNGLPSKLNRCAIVQQSSYDSN